MLIEEILHTCSNEKVAQAALASLGFDFAMRVRSEADGCGVSPGVLVARVVDDFRRSADADERRMVSRVMDKTDQPILVGLRFILDAYMRGSRSADDCSWPIGAALRMWPEMGGLRAG